MSRKTRIFITNCDKLSFEFGIGVEDDRYKGLLRGRPHRYLVVDSAAPSLEYLGKRIRFAIVNVISQFESRL